MTLKFREFIKCFASLTSYKTKHKDSMNLHNKVCRCQDSNNIEDYLWIHVVAVASEEKQTSQTKANTHKY